MGGAPVVGSPDLFLPFRAGSAPPVDGQLPDPGRFCDAESVPPPRTGSRPLVAAPSELMSERARTPPIMKMSSHSMTWASVTPKRSAMHRVVTSFLNNDITAAETSTVGLCISFFPGLKCVA